MDGAQTILVQWTLAYWVLPESSCHCKNNSHIVVGQLYSIQYKSIFGMPDKVRRNMCDKARPLVRSEVLSPTPQWDMRWQSHYIITTSPLGFRTAFLCRCLVLDRPNTSDLMVISMDLFSLALGWARLHSV